MSGDWHLTFLRLVLMYLLSTYETISAIIVIKLKDI